MRGGLSRSIIFLFAASIGLTIFFYMRYWGYSYKPLESPDELKASWKTLQMGGCKAQVVRGSGSRELIINSRAPGSACYYYADSATDDSHGPYLWNRVLSKRGWRVEARVKVLKDGEDPQWLKADDGAREEGLLLRSSGIELFHSKVVIPIDLASGVRRVALSGMDGSLSVHVDGKFLYSGKMSKGSSSPGRPVLAFGDMDWTSGRDALGGSAVSWKEIRYSVLGQSFIAYAGPRLALFIIGLSVISLLYHLVIPKIRRDAKTSPIAWLITLISTPVIIAYEKDFKRALHDLKDVSFKPLGASIEIGVLFALMLLSAEFATRNYASKHWRFFPFDTRYGTQGLDIPELGLKRPEGGGLVVLGIGDSFTYGKGVEKASERFLDRVEALLGSSGVNAHALNAGWPGVGTEAELKFFKEKGLGLKPDIVILSFYLNDIHDTLNYRMLSDPWSIHSPAPSILKPVYAKGYYVEGGTLMELRLLESIPYFASRIELFLDSFRKESLWENGSISRDVYNDWERYRKFYPLETIAFRKEYAPILNRAFEMVLSDIEEMKRMCDERGIKFLLVVIPSDVQAATPGFWDTAKLVLGLDEDDFDLSKPSSVINGFASQKGIAVLDLLPEFREIQSKGKLLYNIGERHWNAEGNRIAAEAILKKMREEGFIPAVKRGRAI